MEIYKKKSKDALMWLICIAYFGMFFPIKVSNYTIVILIGFCFAMSTPAKILKMLKESQFILLIIGMYLVQLVGLLYTSNMKEGLFELEKKIFFVGIPVFLLPLVQEYFDKEDWRKLFIKIGWITIGTSVALLVIAFYKSYILYDPTAFYYGRDLREGFTSIHYPYYSMYYAFGSLLLLNTILDSVIKMRFGYALMTLLFLYSLAIMILIASKTGIIIFGVTLTVILYYRLNRKFFLISMGAVLVSISVLMFFNETTRERFVGLTDNLSVLAKNKLGENVTIDDLNMRLLFWKISIVNAWKDNLVLAGTGTGDVQDYIDNLYKSPQYQLYGYVGWDSHNQWVYTFVQLGVLGLLFMIWLYARFLRSSIQRNDLNFLCFLIITLVFSLSESILETNKGIIFFSLFFTLFSADYIRAKKDSGTITQ